MLFVVGLIAVIFIFTIIVTAYPAVMGSVANDAAANNITNSSHNQTAIQGNAVAVGFMGFTQAEVALVIILLIVAVLLLIFVL
jgi:cell division protein FtsL